MKYDKASAVKIHLDGAARRAAAKALLKAGQLSFWESVFYTGPQFEEDEHTEVEVSVGQSTVNVVVIDKHEIMPDMEYVYPLATVARIKIVA